MRRTRALIIGAGPAGSAAAITLSRAGILPEVIERAAGPRHVVCGSFLSWDGLEWLSALGVDIWSLGARKVGKVRLVSTSQTVVADLPRSGAVLSRRTLDEALLQRAETEGAIVRRGINVRSATPALVRTASGEEIMPDALFLATGKHDLRGLRRDLAARGGAQMLGLRCSLVGPASLHDRLEDVLELHLFNNGYAGLALQEDGAINLCISHHRRGLGEVRGLKGVLALLAQEVPSLRTTILEAQDERWDSIARVPYGWRVTGSPAGLFRLGDQAAVIASLVGDGIAMALRSGVQAAKIYVQDGPAAAIEFQSWWSSRTHVPLATASVLSAAVQLAWSRSALLKVTSRLPKVVGWAARATRAGGCAETS